MITQFSAIVDGVTKKKDGTLSIKLGTQELSPEETAELFKFGNQQLWVAFKDTPVSEGDVEAPDFLPEFDGQKSHSQRLHGVLYKLWELRTDKKKTARQFYEDYMEKLINTIKEKLN